MRGYRGRLTGGAPLILWFLLCCALLLSVTSANAQPFETSLTPSTDWKARYYSLAQKALKLERAWSEHRISYETLKQSFIELEESHQILQTLLTDSRQETERSTALSERLQTRLDAISLEIEMTREIAVKSIRDAWIQGAAIGAGVILVIDLLIWLATLVF